MYLKYMFNFLSYHAPLFCVSETERLLKSVNIDEEPEHVAVNTGTIPCLLCDAVVCSYSVLCKHLMTTHQDQPQYSDEMNRVRQMMRVQCETCGLDFSAPYNLNRHRRLRQCKKGEKGHPCPFCAKISSCLTHLARHLKLIHRSHPQYDEEQNKLRSLLTVHCRLCDNWYPDKNSYQAHYMNSHDKDILRCQYCRKPFKHDRLLQKHITVKHLGTPVKRVGSKRRYFRVCKQCPKSFTDKHELKQHVLLVHKHQRIMYQCDKCPYQYYNTRQYLAHVKFVHSDVGFQCIHCGRSFTSRWFVNKHKKHCLKLSQSQNTSAENETFAEECPHTRIINDIGNEIIVETAPETPDSNINTETKPVQYF